MKDLKLSDLEKATKIALKSINHVRLSGYRLDENDKDSLEHAIETMNILLEIISKSKTITLI